MKQLGQLVQIHQLQQEQSRRVSMDGGQTSDHSASDLTSPPHSSGREPSPELSIDDTEVRSPSQPLGHFKIPKKSHPERIIKQEEETPREPEIQFPKESETSSRDFPPREPPVAQRRAPSDAQFPHPRDWRATREDRREERQRPPDDWHGPANRVGPEQRPPPPDMRPRGPDIPERPRRRTLLPDPVMEPPKIKERTLLPDPVMEAVQGERTLLPDPVMEPMPVDRRGPMGRFDDGRSPFDERRGRNDYDHDDFMRHDDPNIRERDFHDNRRLPFRGRGRGRGSWSERDTFVKGEFPDEGSDRRFRDDMSVGPDNPRGPIRRGPDESWREQNLNREDNRPHDNWDERRDMPSDWENIPRDDRGPPDDPRGPPIDRRDERRMQGPPREGMAPGHRGTFREQGSFDGEEGFNEDRHRDSRKRPRSPPREPFRRLQGEQFKGIPTKKIDTTTGLPPWNPVKDEPMAEEEFNDGPKFRGRGRGRRIEQGTGPEDGRHPPRHKISPGPESSGPKMDVTAFEGPPGRKPRNSERYTDKFGDARFRCFSDFGPQADEEVVIGRKNFEVKLGAHPRRIRWSKTAYIVVSADPVKRGVVIDGNLVYKFGERVKEIQLCGRTEKIFYHGRPLSIWFDNQQFEIRLDSPPNCVTVNGKEHKVQVDGRDMMLLIDKSEKGTYGGPSRFIFVGEERVEVRFEPLPKTIQIDGNFCDLNLNTTVQPPSVLINGIWHGIRFNGPPRDVCIDGRLYQIFTDHAVKLRIGSRFHYVALGGPCHELVVDGRCFEVKFNEQPKEISVSNNVMNVKLPGQLPEVKILPPLFPPGGSSMAPGGPVQMGPPPPMAPPSNLPGQPPIGVPGAQQTTTMQGGPVPRFGPPPVSSAPIPVTAISMTQPPPMLHPPPGMRPPMPIPGNSLCQFLIKLINTLNLKKMFAL